VFCFAYGSISDGIPGKTHRQKQGKREKQKTNMKERSDNCSGCSTP